MASLFAVQQPPFVAPDETAHLGYAHEIADLRLPEIDRAPSVPASATQWIAERDSASDAEHLGVWVANHPPLTYVVAAPLVWLSESAGSADGGLLALRMVNVVFGAAGVAMTYLLASELTGVRRLGLAAAAVVALLPQGHVVFSQGLNDGLAFAAGTAVLWAGVRVLRRGASRGELTLLATTVAIAAGARAAAMLLAVAVVGYVTVARFLSASGPAKVKARAAMVVGVAGLLPAAVLWGWFYVRNVVLYGDFGASNHLLTVFGRRPEGSVIEMTTRGNMWVKLYQRLLSPSTVRRAVPPGLTLVTIAGIVGIGMATLTGRIGDRVDDRHRRSAWRPGLGLCVLAVAVIAVTVAQHASGGGNAYARYLFPVLGALVTMLVVGVDRLVPRIAPVALIAAMAWWAILNIPVDVDVTRPRNRDSTPRPPELLQVLPACDGWRVSCVVLIVAGCLVAGSVLVAGIIQPRPRR